MAHFLKMSLRVKHMEGMILISAQRVSLILIVRWSMEKFIVIEINEKSMVLLEILLPIV